MFILVFFFEEIGLGGIGVFWDFCFVCVFFKMELIDCRFFLVLFFSIFFRSFFLRIVIEMRVKSNY